MVQVADFSFNRCFQSNDFIGAEALYSKAYVHSPRSPFQAEELELT
jgi:hypothetical protein